MIPLRFGSTAPFEGAGGPKRGHDGVVARESALQLLLLDLEHVDHLEQPCLQPVRAAASLDHEVQMPGPVAVCACVVDADEVAAAPAQQRQHARERVGRIRGSEPEAAWGCGVHSGRPFRPTAPGQRQRHPIPVGSVGPAAIQEEARA
jgi:hypothetical protein